MAIDDTTNRISRRGDGTTTAWEIPFRFDGSSWLRVVVTDPAGFATTLRHGVDFLLSGDGRTADATLTTATPVAEDSTLVIQRFTPATQTSVFVPNAPLPARDLENTCDRLAMANQDRDVSPGTPFSRALVLPVSEPDGNPHLLPDAGSRKGKLFYNDPHTGAVGMLSMEDLAPRVLEQYAAGITSTDLLAALSATAPLIRSSPPDEFTPGLPGQLAIIPRHPRIAISTLFGTLDPDIMGPLHPWKYENGKLWHTTTGGDPLFSTGTCVQVSFNVAWSIAIFQDGVNTMKYWLGANGQEGATAAGVSYWINVSTTGNPLVVVTHEEAPRIWQNQAGGGIAPDWVAILPDTFTGTFFRPENYGALGDGITDDTPALQAAIDAACAVRGTVRLSSAVYRTTTPLVIPDSIIIEGAGATALHGPRVTTPADNRSDVMPATAPHVAGTVILVDASGTNGIEITAAGRSVSLRDFAIKFGDDYRFTETGHGILASPPVCAATVFTGEQEVGVSGGGFENILVYGHDGSHYAFSVVNMRLTHWKNCQGWGGGGIDWYANTRGSAGNSTLEQCQFVTFLAGTAHGWSFRAHASSTGGCTLMRLDRPRSYFLNNLTRLEGLANPHTAPATGSQRLLNADDRSTRFQLFGADYASATLNYLRIFPASLATGWEWTDAIKTGDTATHNTSNYQSARLKDDGDILHFGSLNNTGTGTGTGAAEGVSYGTHTDENPVWWGGVYRTGKGMSYIVGTGGGGTAADAEGTPALEIDANGRTFFRNSPKAYATADLARSSTITTTADPALTVALEAGKTYNFVIEAVFNLAISANNSLKFAPKVPANSFLSHQTEMTVATTAAYTGGANETHYRGLNTATNTSADIQAPLYGGACRVKIRMTGTITPTAAGDLSLAWAQFNLTPSVFTRLAGAFIRAEY